MTEITDHFIVERGIPLEVLGGIVSRELTLHGGVVRQAAGTSRGGQIIRHLIPLGGDGTAVADAVGAGPPPLLDGARAIRTAYRMGSALSVEHLQHLKTVSAATAQILVASNATMALAGLNLVVSAIGFAVLNRKLNRIDAKLDEIQKDVKEIRAFLERSERARLRNALRNLANIDIASQSANRHNLLHGLPWRPRHALREVR